MSLGKASLIGFFTIALFFAFYAIARDVEYHEIWGLDVVMWLNQLRTPQVTSYLKVISLFGYEIFVPFLMLFVWASARKDQLFSMGFALILTECFWFQSVLKLYYARPRPWHESLELKSSSTTVSEVYSFPSGHSFASTVVWLTIASHWDIPYWVPALVITLVGISRVSLAVHFPHDILAGIVAGILFLGFWRKLLAISGKSSSISKDLVSHWILIVGIFLTNSYYYDTIFTTAPTGMLYGPIFCIGILLGIHLHSPWGSNKNTYLESFFRYFIGMPVALFPFYYLDIFHMKKGEIDYRIMVLCIFLPVWLFYVAPKAFVTLGLARWRSPTEDDEEEKVVQKKIK